MAVKIRLARAGAKKKPFYHIVAATTSSPRDGRFLEKIGTYNPLLEQTSPERLLIDKDKAAYWLSVGAQPSERVALFLKKMGLISS